VSPMAETTTTTSWPAARVNMTRSATRFILETSATLERQRVDPTLLRYLSTVISVTLNVVLVVANLGTVPLSAVTLTSAAGVLVASQYTTQALVGGGSERPRVQAGGLPRAHDDRIATQVRLHRYRRRHRVGRLDAHEHDIRIVDGRRIRRCDNAHDVATVRAHDGEAVARDGVRVMRAADQRHGNAGAREHAAVIATDGTGAHDRDFRLRFAHRGRGRCSSRSIVACACARYESPKRFRWFTMW